MQHSHRSDFVHLGKYRMLSRFNENNSEFYKKRLYFWSDIIYNKINK